MNTTLSLLSALIFFLEAERMNPLEELLPDFCLADQVPTTELAVWADHVTRGPSHSAHSPLH